ncbi:MAG: AmmeMemoRadiSam system protein B [Methanobacteriota archaeon]
MRRCTVAGMFYPADPVQLTGMLDRFFSHTCTGRDARGIVSPHAGYVYSGQTAAHAFAAIRDGFDGTFLVIGPSHRGFSTCISTIAWDTPLGPVQNDGVLTSLINLPIDERAMSFGNENSLEVQIPFIRYRFPEATMVPIMMGHQTMEEITRISHVIRSALDKYPGDVRIVASSDFSHYVTAEKARKDDLFVIEALKDLNVREFYNRIYQNRITACGYGPIGTMVEVLKNQGVSRCDLLSYTNSGESSGDYSQVVGYAALAVN